MGLHTVLRWPAAGPAAVAACRTRDQRCAGARVRHSRVAWWRHPIAPRPLRRSDDYSL